MEFHSTALSKSSHKTNCELLAHQGFFSFSTNFFDFSFLQPIFEPFTKHHYYESHTQINTFAIVPQGPLINFDEPHTRNF